MLDHQHREKSSPEVVSLVIAEKRVKIAYRRLDQIQADFDRQALLTTRLFEGEREICVGIRKHYKRTVSSTKYVKKTELEKDLNQIMKLEGNMSEATFALDAVNKKFSK
ncbi:hypothetical protein QR680_004063 [Steinernema hermaphroditum]|uniref:Uncharacterized protein n=1 Tax=Steinernema hermaphroditum TaxID=289476 RepID=A0AA39HPS2_9BILA|nr:hypothetical protein QR680_004063 [Steinernema hermaphroditum]